MRMLSGRRVPYLSQRVTRTSIDRTFAAKNSEKRNNLHHTPRSEFGNLVKDSEKVESLVHSSYNISSVTSFFWIFELFLNEDFYNRKATISLFFVSLLFISFIKHQPLFSSSPPFPFYIKEQQ